MSDKEKEFKIALAQAVSDFKNAEIVDIWGLTESRSGKSGWKKIIFYFKETK